ncbi:hypothetical protein ACFFQF_15280 [Haladaptatus pallidirubidus]|uniref:Uncharacterized protein n=1 Tax=Haladaptatus pallidirubidus TaxID=1008152 RepID=A0AAV3UCF9_9EURY|nr:hypothetical protein [Haladaptatus pallidirubidus]
MTDNRRPTTDTQRTESDNRQRTNDDQQTMADVDHTPPREAPGANRVFERGNEGRR